MFATGSMRRLGFFCWILAALAATPAVRAETPAEFDARMRWWRDARFGMFVYWGCYSVAAGVHQGKEYSWWGEKILYQSKMPLADYKKLAEAFNPTKFNADDWVRLARAAGMKYILYSAKAQDGFAMYDSKASDWSIARATPYKKDPLKSLAEACDRHGLKLGVYYSHWHDWYHRGGGINGEPWDPAQRGNFEDYYRKIAIPQMRELLANYGLLGTVVWEQPGQISRPHVEMMAAELKEQPAIISGSRLGPGFRGDMESPLMQIPNYIFPNKDWETCLTINDSGGYKKNDNKWKDAKTLVRNLIETVSKGGNCLFIVGPDAEGVIPKPAADRLREVGKWMDRFGESIYGTTASPFLALPTNVWCTQKTQASGVTLYFHLIEWPSDGMVAISGMKNQVEGAWLVGDPKKRKIYLEQAGDSLLLHLTGGPVDPIASVLAVRIKGPPDVKNPLCSQEPDGTIRLMPYDAVMTGKSIRYDVSNNATSIGNWGTGETIAWTFLVNRPGQFVVSGEFAAVEPGNVELTLGSARMSFATPKTGGFDKPGTAELGTVEIPAAGTATLTLRASTAGWKGCNVRKIILKPK